MDRSTQLVVCSSPDRERLFLEIWLGDDMCEELNQECDRLVLQIYPRRDGRPWEIDFEEAMLTLAEAKKKLVDR
jgi:hypothetical protein